MLGRGKRPPDLRRVYTDHVEAVYAFFAYSVREAEAEDLTSATFERVVRSWSSYDAAKAGVRTWILAIARNILTDHWRRQSHRSGPSLDEHPALVEWQEAPAFEGPLERTLSADELRSWLGRVGERERQILALRYAADLPAAEIAELLDLTPANVQQILSRTLRKLRAEAP